MTDAPTIAVVAMLALMILMNFRLTSSVIRAHNKINRLDRVLAQHLAADPNEEDEA